MSYPPITADQRDMAITMLANALRRVEPQPSAPAGTLGAEALVHQAGQRQRREGAEAYVRGMVDLLAVLFPGGRPFAEACLAEATVIARGEAPRPPRPELN